MVNPEVCMYTWWEDHRKKWNDMFSQNRLANPIDGKEKPGSVTFFTSARSRCNLHKNLQPFRKSNHFFGVKFVFQQHIH